MLIVSEVFFTFGTKLFILNPNLMKSKVLLFLLLAFMPVLSAMADNVDRDAASVVAHNFYYERQVQAGLNASISEINPMWIDSWMLNDQPVFHVFNFSQGGFVIVSGEDAYSPIIGYAKEGKFPEGELDPNYASFLRSYEDQINFIRENNIAQSAEVQQSWQEYNSLNTSRMMLTGDRDVEPLISVLWNQDYPYNAYCPDDAAGPGGHPYAGCVATAMSMVMNYYRYPEQGAGQHSYYYPGYGYIEANFGETYYDWDAMLNSIDASSGSAINAIAELQFHCGVAVNMQYDVDGSGAFSSDVPAAMRTYFGYANNIQHLEKSDYPLATWEGFITTSLTAKKPLYYFGRNSDGGHAFVLDGYEVTGTGNMYHFNFGWSGSGNGNYTISDVNGFTNGQGMVRNFVPDAANYPYGCSTHVITAPKGIFEDRSGPLADYEPGKTCSWLIAPEDSVTSITLNFNAFDIAAGDVVNIYDGEDVSAPLLASYTTGGIPEQLTSTGDRVFVEFLTDASGEAPGFIIEFSSSIVIFCSGTTNLTEPTGSFSDGSGDKNYNNGVICKWKIDPGPYADNLTLAFTSFDLEDGKDFLKVYAIPSNELIATLTGSEIPEPIVSPTGKMMLFFISNGFNPAQGFEADYYIDNVSTPANELATNLSVYPNPASSFTDVKLSVEQVAKTTFAISDLAGREVYRQEKLLVAGFNTTTLRFGDLKAGVYILNINNENGSLSRKLIVE
jgi:hypothetical protein